MKLAGGNSLWRLAVVVFLGVSALVSIGYFLLRDREIILSFTEHQLLDEIDTRLPWSERYLFIFEVAFDNPRIDLVENSDRISGGLDVTLNIYLNDEPIPLGGAVDLSGGVRYEPASGSFYLTEPKVEQVRIVGVPDRLANKANEAISFALQDFYETRPIYVLTLDDVGTAAARLLLKDVYVSEEKLFVRMSLSPDVQSKV